MGVADIAFAYIHLKNRKDMLMKRIIMMALSAFIVCSLLCVCSCGAEVNDKEKLRIRNATYGNPDCRKSNIMMIKLWSAVEENNAQAIESMFSEKAKQEIKDYEVKIKNFIGAFNGDIVEVTEIACPSFKSKNNKNVTSHRVDGIYNIETTEGVYRLSFCYIVKNESNPEEVGLYWLFLRPDDEGNYNADGDYNIFVYPFKE